MKTEIAEQVGKHAFEVAGLGRAPFRFVGASENVITYPDGTQKAGGTCDYCGTGIRIECRVQSADSKSFVVGCNCIAKVGDTGLMQAYKSSPEFRAKQREIRNAKSKGIASELERLINQQAEKLSQKPHPQGFTDRVTGKPLTALDEAQWMFAHCGDAGRLA